MDLNCDVGQYKSARGVADVGAVWMDGCGLEAVTSRRTSEVRSWMFVTAMVSVFDY